MFTKSNKVMNEDEIEEWWSDINEGALEEFILQWFSEIDLDEEDSDELGGKVVLMNFLAPDDFQWKFIVKAYSLASKAEYLETMAAGPVEHLLSHHGEKWIEEIEQKSEVDENFAWMMTGVWQNSMTDDIWNRVQKIQSKVESTN